MVRSEPDAGSYARVKRGCFAFIGLTVVQAVTTIAGVSALATIAALAGFVALLYFGYAVYVDAAGRRVLWAIGTVVFPLVGLYYTYRRSRTAGGAV